MKVMVTGAGGSIGSELVRQTGASILVDRAEGPLYDIEQETGGTAYLADVTDRRAMARIVKDERPDLILHAAAYKHVPMLERHPADAIHVNVAGTLSIIAAATCRVVVVSTDKAVEPTSVMGAAKRLAEIATLRAGQTVVRLGNVRQSSGSVGLIFERQIRAGGPLTLTDPEMVRYFISVERAAASIIAAADLEPGLYVPEMGDPVRMLDFAEEMMRRLGRVPVRIIGLRPGEKLREALFWPDERRSPAGNGLIRARGTLPGLDLVDLLRAAAAGDHDRTRSLLWDEALAA